MDIFGLLRQEHAEIDDLLRRIEQPVDTAPFDHSGRRHLLDRLVIVASRHEAAEEVVLWPEVRSRLRDGDSVAERGLHAERDARLQLDLLTTEHSDDGIIARAAALRLLVQEHARFEETEVFPAMHRCTTVIWRRLAARKYRLALRVAPTRPHPDGPSTPLALATVGLPAVLIDHLRDRRDPNRRLPEGRQPDAIEVIEEDHRQIRRLMASIESEPDPVDALVDEAIQLLAVHDSIERQHLYPIVRLRVDDGGDVYGRLLREQGDIASQAAKIEGYRFHDGSRKQWLDELVADARAHMEWEERRVLPALARHLTSEELTVLGAELTSARRKAPTRPHPHLAGAGAGARLSSRLVGPLDRSRDALTRRGSARTRGTRARTPS